MQIIIPFLSVIAAIFAGMALVRSGSVNSSLRATVAKLRSRLCYYSENRTSQAVAKTADANGRIDVVIIDEPITIHIKSFPYDSADERSYAQLCADELCDEINKRV